MKTFTQMVGASPAQLRENRVKNACKNTAAASQKYIEDLKQQFRTLQNDFENHLDLGITNRDDLASQLKSHNSEGWTAKIHPMATELAVLSKKIVIASNLHNALFPENKVTGLETDDKEFIKEVVGDLTII